MKAVLAFTMVFLCAILSAQQFGKEIELTSTTDMPEEVVPADVDNDGDIDIILLSSLDGEVGWFENDPELDWRYHIIDLEGHFPRAIHGADLNDDGLTDLVIGTSPYRVVWLENLGGLFSGLKLISTEVEIVKDIETSDIDNDGDLDVISGSSLDNKVAWYANDGTGNFDAQVIVPFDVFNLQQVEVADLNGDGHLDLIGRSSFNQKIAWCANNGTGVFGEEQVITENEHPLTNFEAADIDADGDMDLVITSQVNSGESGGDLIWIENIGSGVFGAEHMIALTGVDPFGLEIKDIDSDGDLDVFTGGRQQGLDQSSLMWFPNNGNGSFGERIEQDPGLSGVSDQVVLVDLSDDSQLDLISVYGNKDIVTSYINQGMGQFGPKKDITRSLNAPGKPISVDLNEDGRKDILCYESSNSHKVVWFEHLEDHTYLPARNLADTMNCISALTGDMDNDGDIDVVTKSWSGNALNWHEYLGNETWESATDESFLVATTGGITFFYLEDLDGDGFLDLVTNTNTDIPSDSRIRWSKNLGASEFGPWLYVDDNPPNPGGMAFDDFNNDGAKDILVSSSGAGGLIWYENDGSEGFDNTHLIIPNSIGMSRMNYKDLNNDGLRDIITYDQDNNRLIKVINQGNGEFSPYEYIGPEDLQFRQLHLEDINADDAVDILMTMPDFSVICLYNDGADNFLEPEVLIEFYDQATFINCADMDEDGDMEILLTSFLGDKVSYFNNLLGEGCIDPSACNYDPQSWIDNGSCCYECGCTIQGAENYSESACQDDGSCGFLLTGTVFYDENENGVMDGTEYGLPLMELGFLPDSSALITNDDGVFFATAQGATSYSLTLAESELFPYHTTPSTLAFDATQDNWNQGIFFGLSNEIPTFDLEVQLYSPNFGYPCDVYRRHDIHFRNAGNLPVYGTVELEFDSLFQGYQEVSPIDSVISRTIFISYDSLVPGQSMVHSVKLATPVVDFIGAHLTSSATVSAFYDNTEVATGEASITKELTCAYDPNDKHVFPRGYTEDHFVGGEDYLEFFIRFQNTGNAFATDVVIRDTIDANLDLSTFELVANSHSVFTTVKPDSREVEFFFQDIQLPDSVNNEPESHGLVSYKIIPIEGLPLLTELNNTASIFFDNNPPIVTNTTWSTIYGCSLFEVSFTDEGALLTATEGDSYQWYLDGEPIDGATAQTFEAFVNGEYAVQVSNDFPCSELTPSVFILVDAIEELTDSPIALFPNPFTESAVLDLGELRGEFLIEIFNIKGQMIRSKTVRIDSGTVNLERGNLVFGTYLLKVSSDQDEFELTFVVD